MHDLWRKGRGTEYVQCVLRKVRGNYLPAQKSLLAVRWVLADTQPFVKPSDVLLRESQNSFGEEFSVCVCQGCWQHVWPVCRGQGELTGPQGITAAPQLLRTETSQMCFLSRLVKLSEVFRRVISCLQLKIAILSKFIELYGFTIPAQLLFQAFISCAQHQQGCSKCLNFAFVMELAWQAATRSSCIFLNRFFAGEGPRAPGVCRQCCCHCAGQGLPRKVLGCPGQGQGGPGTAEVMPAHPCAWTQGGHRGMLPARLLLQLSCRNLTHDFTL